MNASLMPICFRIKFFVLKSLIWTLRWSLDHTRCKIWIWRLWIIFRVYHWQWFWEFGSSIPKLLWTEALNMLIFTLREAIATQSLFLLNSETIGCQSKPKWGNFISKIFFFYRRQKTSRPDQKANRKAS